MDISKEAFDKSTEERNKLTRELIRYAQRTIGLKKLYAMSNTQLRALRVKAIRAKEIVSS